MEFVDYKCLESLLIEGELIATEGIGDKLKDIGSTIVGAIVKALKVIKDFFINMLNSLKTFASNWKDSKQAQKQNQQSSNNTNNSNSGTQSKNQNTSSANTNNTSSSSQLNKVLGLMSQLTRSINSVAATASKDLYTAASLDKSKIDEFVANFKPYTVNQNLVNKLNSLDNLNDISDADIPKVVNTMNTSIKTCVNICNTLTAACNKSSAVSNKAVDTVCKAISGGDGVIQQLQCVIKTVKTLSKLLKAKM